LEPKFTTDDKIQLKSGTGPVMTCAPRLEGFPRGRFSGSYWCRWFDEGKKKFRLESIPEEFLKKVE